MKKLFTRIFDFFSSIKLAVPLLLTLAVILAIGTFYEAEYGTAAAQRDIYRSVFMSVEMFLLIINLMCAVIDRLPWKKHHTGFVITHAGIITLLLGSFITQQKGIDGNLALGINDAADTFIIPDMEIHIYQNLDGKPFFKLKEEPVNFDKRAPENHEYVFKLADDDKLRVVHYFEKAVRAVDVKESSDPANLPAIHFTLSNERVNVSEWIGLDKQLPPFYDLGPATVSIISGPLPKPPQPRNQIVVYQPNPKKDQLKVAVFSARKPDGPVVNQKLEIGKPVNTGWMNLQFNADKFIPHSLAVVNYTEADRQNTANIDSLPSAIEVDLNGKRKWIEAESPAEIRGDKTAYFVSYTHRRMELGFQIALKKFKMGVYGGSQLPMSYESTVLVNNKIDRVISMNEPLTFNEFTLYQSSFEQNERGEPVVSIFSVNYDPGRRMKYFGSICIVAGIATMFYWKPRWSRKKRTA